MTQAQAGDIVRVHYTGKLTDGTLFDTSVEREPLEFTLGEGELIAGFEQTVLGMMAGESRTAMIPCDQAYGPHYAERVIQVERHHLPADLRPTVGQQLQMSREDGATITAMVTTVTEAHIMLDANHPLAGQDLIFEITLVEIL
ncbi:MAG: peptidylprolyl isomerase [Candidatus Tectomicrobia bacterium]|uniref:Peptidyl-prolyl cis-trans isomerase n=1 Tax=Tectimicrobiota bacterium TaxID=2528274 RepID=A0A937W458_UNCTE|nr:peptidylprolyl isomerase [Candidatus Tectomicrobia bacterium]